MKIILFTLLFILSALSGCSSDEPQPLQPEESFIYSVEVLSFSPFPVGFIGDTVTTTFQVTAYEVSEKGYIGPIVGAMWRAPAGTIIRVSTNDAVTISNPTLVTDSSGTASFDVTSILLDDVHPLFELSFVVEEDTSFFHLWNYSAHSRTERFFLEGSTHKLVVPAGVPARISLTGFLYDDRGIGIGGMPLSFQLERSGGDPVGGLTTPYAYTTSGGNFTLIYSSNGSYGTETVTVTAEWDDFPASRVTTSYTIETVTLESQIGSVSLHAAPDWVALPVEGEAELALKAVVRDISGVPMEGIGVNFTTSHGLINLSAVTDKAGLATAMWHTGIDTGSATIGMSITGTNVTNTSQIRLDRPEVPHVSSINLFADDPSLIANSNQSTILRAVVQESTGRVAEEGTIIGFEILSGTARLEVNLAIVDESGTASVRLYSGLNNEATELRAYYQNPNGNRIESNVLTIRSHFGPPTNLTISADPPIINNIDQTTAEITARLTDQWSNPISGKLIQFIASGGVVEPSAITSDEGEASVTFDPQNWTGLANLRAELENLQANVEIEIAPASIAELEISSSAAEMPASPIGNVLLTATAFDRNGTRIRASYPVHFKLISAPRLPEGCSFGNNSQIDSANTLYGSATVLLFSGEQTGSQRVRAITWRDPDTLNAGPDGIPRTDSLYADFVVTITGGMPASIQLSPDPRGIDNGNGLWRINLACLVFDRNGNIANSGYNVNFNLDTAWATVAGPQRIVDGQAHTYLIYHSLNTLKRVTVTAWIATELGIISNQVAIALPLQRGYLTLAADPGNWPFRRENPGDSCLVRLSAVLRDGHDVTVNNCPLVFTLDRGYLYWRHFGTGRYHPYFPNPARKITGQINQESAEPNGTATVFIRGRQSDFFPDEFASEVSVHAEVRVEGEDIVSNPVTVRFPGNNRIDFNELQHITEEHYRCFPF